MKLMVSMLFILVTSPVVSAEMDVGENDEISKLDRYCFFMNVHS